MLFLDCEFDGHKGQLISMAIVHHNYETDGESFYGVLYHEDVKNQWVIDNVIPVLDREPTSLVDFKDTLFAFLRRHVGDTIVADSPADIVYLMDLLHGVDENNKYYYEDIPVKCMYINSGRLRPKTPHNALSDALALKKWYEDTERAMRLP